MNHGLNKFSLNAKLMFGAAFVSLCLAVTGGIGVLSMTKLRTTLNEVTDVNLVKVEVLSDIRYYGAEVARLFLRASTAGLPASEVERLTKKLEEHVELVEKAEVEYLKLPQAEGEKELFDAQKAKWLAFVDVAREGLKVVNQATHTGDVKLRESVETFAAKTVPKAKVEHNNAFDVLIKFQKTETAKTREHASQMTEAAIRTSAALVIIGFITNLVLGAWFARSISRALNQIAARLSLGGTEVSAAAKQVATTSDLLASSSAQQAASLEETAASLEEITSIVANNAANARRAAELSALSSEKARSGETQVAELLSAMGEISASSRKIEEIVNVIDDIAFQTNLLALNAAVEAARAGEQGRGFAVVAEAVRALSQRSATSARDITNLISESSMKIERGVRTADASGSILKEIVSSVGEVSELNGSISQACQEQSQGVNQISQAVHQLNQVTQEQSQTSQVAAETAQILQDQSAALHETVHDLETTVRGRTARAVDFESPRSGPPDHPFSNSTESSHLGMRRAA